MTSVKVVSSVLGLVGFAVVAMVLSVLPVSPAAVEAQNTGPESVIVELDQPSVLEETGTLEASEPAIEQSRAAVHNQHLELLEAIEASSIDIDVQHRYSLAFNGLALDVPSDAAEEIRRLPGVVEVHPDITVTSLLEESVSLVDAPGVWERTDPDGDDVLGTDQIVAVIDTGIDYNHPALGEGFGPDNRVIGGYDFVNNDEDPMDDHGHGTHVAGIVAADGNVRGVAPGASLTAYKALDDQGNGDTSDVIAALDVAADPDNPDRADVINLSLGAQGDGTDPLSLAVQTIADAGGLVVASAGNDGPGTATVSAPGSAAGALTVGASTSGLWDPVFELVEPSELPIVSLRYSYSATAPEEPEELDLVHLPDGLDEETDIEGDAVLARIQGLFPRNEAEQLEAAGAAAVLQYSGAIPGDFRSVDEQEGTSSSTQPGAELAGRLSIVAVSVAADEAGRIVSAMGDNDGTVVLSGEDTDDTLADFSSRGPGGLMNAKPDLVAPGVDIASLAHVEEGANGLVRNSGTSMAAPHVAGAAALLSQLHPEWDARTIRGALVGSSIPLDADTTEVGAGRLDVSHAADVTVVADEVALSFGLADATGETTAENRVMTLYNTAADMIDVEIAAESFTGDAAVEPEAMTLGPGERGEVQVSATGDVPRASADLSGVITVTPDEGAAVRVPYLLAVRHLDVHATPDPAATRSDLFVYSPLNLAGSPTASVISPDGEVQQVPLIDDPQPGWWRGEIADLAEPGVWQLEAEGVAAGRFGGAEIVGQGRLEVVDTHAAEHEWESVGPNASGASVSAVAEAPGQLAVPRGGTDLGLMMTQDIGESWRYSRVGLFAGGSGSVVTDPADPDRLYYAVSGGLSDPAYSRALLVSDDLGDTWTTMDAPASIDMLHVGQDGQLLVGLSETALHVSINRGETWFTRTLPWDPSEGTQDSLLEGNTLYVASRDGLYEFPDVTDRDVPPELIFVGPGNQPWISHVATSEDVLLVVAQGGTVHRSADEGNNWEEIFQIPVTPATVTGLYAYGDRYFVTGLSRIYVSTDAGEVFEEWERPVTTPNGIVEWDEVDQTIVSKSASGIYHRTDDGGYRSMGPPGGSEAILAGSTTEGVERLVAGTAYGVMSTDLPDGDIFPETREWEGGSLGTIGAAVRRLAVNPDSPEIMYRLSHGPFSDFSVARSDDGGQTWQTVKPGWPEPEEDPQALHVHPADPDRVIVSYGNPQAIMRSDDGGNTWQEIHHSQTYQAIAGDPEDPDVVWFGAADGLYRSDDFGLTAELVDGSSPVSSLFVDPRVPERLVVGGRELRTTVDNGDSFETVDLDGLRVWVSSVAASPHDPDELYAATRSFSDAGLIVTGRGVLRSENGGSSFSNISTGLDSPSVIDLTFDDSGDWLFASTTAAGVQRLDVQPPAIESVVVSPDPAEIAAGDAEQLTATAHYDDDTTENVTDEAQWASDDEGIASVDDAGEVTGVAEGETDVTATFESESDSADVIVTEGDVPPPEDPVDLVVEPSEATVGVGGVVQLEATAIYEDDRVDVTEEADWASDDTDVVTVDDAGLATAVAEGSADVTAEFEGESDSAEVTVTEDDVPPPEDPVDVVVSPDEATVGVDGVAQLEATAVYDDDQSVDVTDEAEWVSGDEDIAAVDDAGLVVGLAEGATEVTVTFEGLSDSASVTVDAEVEPGPEGLERISAEPGRVEVAIAASEHRFDEGEASAVVLARADEYPDALAGTTLAAEHDAPLLLTSSDELLGNVADEIARVLGDDGAVFLTGGTAALDDTVEDAVGELGYELTRLGGETRFETAGLIAEELGERSQVLITTGLDFPDALTAGAAASANDGVVLLSADDDPHDVVDEYLDGFDGEVTAVGGPATRAYPDAQAVMGATRDETAVAVAEAFFDEPVAFGVARRDDYPDALSGGAHIAAYEGPLLLTYTEDVPDETAGWLSESDATGGFVYGGTAAISDEVFDELEALAFE